MTKTIKELVIGCAVLSGCVGTAAPTTSAPTVESSVSKETAATADKETLHDLGGGQFVRVLSLAQVEANRQMSARLSAAAAKQGLAPQALVAHPAIRAKVDHIADQTANRSQGGRSTCTYFATVAALEAEYKRQGYGDLDLSEQYLVWLRNVSGLSVTAPSGGPSPAESNAQYKEDDIGGGGGGGADYNVQLLQRYGIPTEADSPYIGDGQYENVNSSYYAGYDLAGYKWDNQQFPQAPLDAWNLAPAQLPDAARTGARYGVIDSEAFSRQQLQNPAFIEQLVSAGHDVAVDFLLHDDWLGHAADTPVVKRGANAVGGHAVLIIGYDHARKFFVVKNSWGNGPQYNPAQFPAAWQDVAHYNGYYLVDYQYIVDTVSSGGMVKQVAPPAQNRFAAQNALGTYQLQIYRNSTNEVVAQGTMSWRHIPNTFWFLAQPDARAGDVTLNGTQYRVNADVSNYPNTTMYIDFNGAGTSYDSLSGAQLNGAFDGDGAEVSGSVSSPDGTLFGVPTDDLSFWGSR